MRPRRRRGPSAQAKLPQAGMPRTARRPSRTPAAAQVAWAAKGTLSVREALVMAPFEPPEPPAVKFSYLASAALRISLRLRAGVIASGSIRQWMMAGRAARRVPREQRSS